MRRTLRNATTPNGLAPLPIPDCPEWITHCTVDVMLRRRLHRALPGLLSAWFALASLQPGVLRPCPMHDGAAPAASAPAATEMAGHAHHAPADRVPEPAHPCDCVVACCGVPPMALVLAPSRVAAGVIVWDEPVALDPALSHAPSRARLLPYANGPPGLASG